MYRRFFKRIMDFCLSLLALIVLSPILVILTIIGIFAMGGNPFFAQSRPGKKDKNGKEKIFKLIKFRTMNNKKDVDGNLLPDEDRLTGYGKFLRATSLDELMELVNILKGDMSIVGPRPALPREVEQYDEYLKQRLYVTPGLTCYWQIQPHRNDLTFDEWMELDIQYIRDRSFATDWMIILKTVGAVLGMNGQ